LKRYPICGKTDLSSKPVYCHTDCQALEKSLVLVSELAQLRTPYFVLIMPHCTMTYIDAAYCY